jgi:hypothetical protein
MSPSLLFIVMIYFITFYFVFLLLNVVKIVIFISPNIISYNFFQASSLWPMRRFLPLDSQKHR